MAAKTLAEKFWMGRIASLPCVVCKRLGFVQTQIELHHVAENSGVRSNFSVVPLCAEHHRGATGIHSGTKAFIRRFRPFGDSEFGLIVWTNADLAAKDSR